MKKKKAGNVINIKLEEEIADKTVLNLCLEVNPTPTFNGSENSAVHVRNGF